MRPATQSPGCPGPARTTWTDDPGGTRLCETRGGQQTSSSAAECMHASHHLPRRARAGSRRAGRPRPCAGGGDGRTGVPRGHPVRPRRRPALIGVTHRLRRLGPGGADPGLGTRRSVGGRGLAGDSGPGRPVPGLVRGRQHRAQARAGGPGERGPGRSGSRRPAGAGEGAVALRSRRRPRPGAPPQPDRLRRQLCGRCRGCGCAAGDAGCPACPAPGLRCTILSP